MARFVDYFDGRFTVTTADGLYVHGVDISGWQGNYQPEPDDVFGIIKLTQGRSFQSAEAGRQVANFTALNRLIGGYHWCDGVYPAAQEAANYIDKYSQMVSVRGGAHFTLPHTLDLEAPATPGQGWDAYADEVGDRIEQATGMPVMIYTAPWWTAGRLHTNVGGRDLWVAQYIPGGKRYAGPDIPPAWDDWVLWQWTSTPLGMSLDRNVAQGHWIAQYAPDIKPGVPGVRVPGFFPTNKPDILIEEENEAMYVAVQMDNGDARVFLHNFSTNRKILMSDIVSSETDEWGEYEKILAGLVAIGAMKQQAVVKIDPQALFLLPNAEGADAAQRLQDFAGGGGFIGANERG